MCTIARGTIGRSITRATSRRRISAALISILASVAAPTLATADEGGVSFWLPGSFGSLAATPATPGWSFAAIYYHTSVDASANVARSRVLHAGRFNPALSVTLNATLDAKADLVFVSPTYTFANPVWGGQLALSVIAAYGRAQTTIDAAINGTLGPIGFAGARSLTESVTGFSDLYPQATLKWNQGVHNYMLYSRADVPVGDYEAGRLANIGIGHWAIDGGVGYTYFDPTKGHELSFVTGLTYNFENPDTNYQNGIDWHLDWGISQFLSKQVHVGAVGYFYNQLTGDSGSGAVLGDFKSRVMGIGPQIGFIFPIAGQQGYLNFKGYYEFDADNRPEGWNAWVTFAISEAEKPAAVSPRPTIRK